MDGGRKEQRWKKNEIPVCSYARRYITDIIEVCGRNVEEGGAEKWKTSSSGIPAYWPRCFLPHFSKFSLCPPFDSATNNNAALSTIPEGFSSILCIYTIPPPFEDQASCQLYTSARFSISRRGNRGMKLKKKSRVSIAGRHWTRGRRWFLLFCVASIAVSQVESWWEFVVQSVFG